MTTEMLQPQYSEILAVEEVSPDNLNNLHLSQWTSYVPLRKVDLVTAPDIARGLYNQRLNTREQSRTARKIVQGLQKVSNYNAIMH